ncbi:DUF1129 domain-containing protein [Streptococcus sp. zg-JUN1979]|uniref:DUF1129 domain-containing protein n=1 Tax=Streptococcus sp. zg-JUN1979 TaxID=3391450 RepID=UPI0039A4E7F9
MTTHNYPQLTHKNQEFIYIATKQLRQDGKSEQEITDIINDVMPVIIENQEKSIPARNILGAPTVWAASFSQSEGSKEHQASQKNTNPWLMWLDTSLLFIGIIALVNGLMLLFNAKTATNGLFSILTLGFGGGGAMYATYHFVYRHLGKPKSERPSWFKALFMIALATLLWLTLVSIITLLLPASFNVALPYGLLFLLSLVSLGLRYYLQKKYNIQNSLAPTPK